MARTVHLFVRRIQLKAGDIQLPYSITIVRCCGVVPLTAALKPVKPVSISCLTCIKSETSAGVGTSRDWAHSCQKQDRRLSSLYKSRLKRPGPYSISITQQYAVLIKSYLLVLKHTKVKKKRYRKKMGEKNSVREVTITPEKSNIPRKQWMILCKNTQVAVIRDLWYINW